ncbi:MAG TPA: hypothetical protein VIH45_03490 [Desulfuromonadaceae bacterium]
MKRVLITAVAVGVLALPAHAARQVYLKDGGVIKAQSVWRSHGKVQVLVNRDTLVEFWPAEVEMKRTFPKRHPVPRKQAAAGRQAPTAPNGPVAVQKPEEKKSGMSLPKMPKLPEAKPESLMPGGDEGAIRKHKREMLEKTGE